MIWHFRNVKERNDFSFNRIWTGRDIFLLEIILRKTNTRGTIHVMKFFEWASFLLASVMSSGGDMPPSVEAVSAPSIVISTQKKLMVSSEEIIKNENSVEKKEVKQRFIIKNDTKLIENQGLPSKSFESGVILHIPENSSLVVEEQVGIRIGDKFAAVIVDPVSGEIFSQSEWVEVKK